MDDVSSVRWTDDRIRPLPPSTTRWFVFSWKQLTLSALTQLRYKHRKHNLIGNYHTVVCSASYSIIFVLNNALRVWSALGNASLSWREWDEMINKISHIFLVSSCSLVQLRDVLGWFCYVWQVCCSELSSWSMWERNIDFLEKEITQTSKYCFQSVYFVFQT